jgi:uncharacterized protein YneF (UPF0154 family)
MPIVVYVLVGVWIAVGLIACMAMGVYIAKR